MINPEVITRSDYWRRSPASGGGTGGHKEWSYFCVCAPDVDVLVNFSLMDRPHGSGAHDTEVPRLVLLARLGDGQWHGGMEEFEGSQATIHGGLPDLSMAGNRLHFVSGRYIVQAHAANSGVGVDLCLRPVARPAVASSVRLSPDGAMRWSVIPRLVADGRVDVDGRSYLVRRAPAYHDRNWGRFDWGEDFSWEWAAVLPETGTVPWSLVYMRIGDRHRNRTRSNGLMLWRDDRPWRVFHGRQVSISNAGLIEQRSILRVPPVTRLLAGRIAADVPRSMQVHARAGDDDLSLEIEHDDLAQVGIPNDRVDGMTLLSEVRGRARVRGRVYGESIDYNASAMVELNHAAN